MSSRIELPCGHHVSEDWLMGRAGQISSARRKTPTGGAMPGAGRPQRMIDCPRGCGHRCGVVAMRSHRCKAAVDGD